MDDKCDLYQWADDLSKKKRRRKMKNKGKASPSAPKETLKRLKRLMF